MIRPVSYATILDDPNANRLLSEYAAECFMPELGYAAPQPELYARMEASGGFQAFGAYDGEVLVGFAGAVAYPLPHSGHWIGVNESIFLTASHRRSGLGEELKEAMRQYVRSKGGVVFIWTAQAESSFDHSLSESLNLRHSNNSYVERL